MSKAFINRSHVEGVLYQHNLESKVSGPNSANPNTPYIRGTIDIATDDAMTNIVSVNYTYVTPTTKKGDTNANYNTLMNIINGVLCTKMAVGAENAARVRVDSAIGLNEFYSDRNGQEELVSVKRNEGGFIHVVQDVNPDEKQRSTFDVDMVITNVRRTEADESKGLPEKMTLKGCIFDFRKALLPIELSVLNPYAMDYFDGLEISNTNPTFTHLKGVQISETVVKKIEETSAWGEVSVRDSVSTRKDFVVTWAAQETYPWDEEGSITANEMKEAMAARQTYLATQKQRRDEYKASKAQGSAAPAITASGFNF